MSEVTYCPELIKAKKELEFSFNIGPIGNSSVSPTGEPYVEICSGGIRKEYEEIPAWFSFPKLAVEFWKRAVTEYTDGVVESENKTIYWRVFPELCEWPVISVRTLYSVYSRLLISSKPRIKSVA